MSVYTESAFVLTGNNYSGNIEIDAQVQSSGAGRVDFMLWSSNGASGINGYLFVFSAINGEQPGQIYKVTNGTATSIATYSVPANSAQLSGGQNMKCLYYALAGLFLIFLNGAQVATATDNTYAVNGPVGYGSEVAQGSAGNLSVKASPPAPSIINQGSLATQNGATTDWAGLYSRSYSNTQIRITALEQFTLKNASNQSLTLPPNVLTLNITVTGAGGSVTGTPLAYKEYMIFFIYNPDTLTLSSIAYSSSDELPPYNLPSGYTYWAFLCFYMTDSSSHLLPQHQYGLEVFYDQRLTVTTGTYGTWQALDILNTGHIPGGAYSVTLFAGNASNTTYYSVDGVNEYMHHTSPQQFSLPCLIEDPGIQQLWYYTSAGTPTVYVLGYKFLPTVY